jgi:hypothetical protein
MAASSLLDGVKFLAAAGGTVDFAVSSAIAGFMTPAGAGGVNAAQYSYYARSADFTQWEIGFGAYSTSGTPTLARGTVKYNSSGNTSKINFTLPPIVAIVPLAQDLPVPAGAGAPGDYLSATASGVAMVSNTPKTIVTLSVTAGDWDVEGTLEFTSTGTTQQVPRAGLNTTTNAFGGLGTTTIIASTSTTVQTIPTPTVRFSFGSPTNVFLVGQIVFSGGSVAAAGLIRARRLV